MAAHAGRRAEILFGVCVAAGVLAFAWIGFHPFYETNDDAGMRMILEGRYAPGARPEAHLLNINFLVGSTLVAARTWLPGLPWYDLMLACPLALATVVVGATLRPRDRRRWIVFAGFLLTFWVPSLVALQFSRVSTLLAGAGCLLLVDAVLTDESRMRQLTRRGAPAFACILGASLIRFGTSLIALATVAAMMIPPAVIAWRRRQLAGWAMPVAVAACGVVAVVAVTYYDEQSYSRYPAWARFPEYNRMRARVAEQMPLAASERLDTVLKAAGWSENDFKMLTAFFFSNAETFGYDRMRAAAEAASAERRSGGVGVWTPASVVEVVRPTAEQSLLPVMFLLGCWLLVGDRRLALSAIQGGLAAMAILIALNVVFKGIPTRIAWPLWTIAIAVVLRLADSGPPVRSRIRVVLGTLMVLMCAAGILAYVRDRSLARHERAERLDRDLDALPPSPDRIYVIQGTAFPREDFVRPFARTPAEGRFRFVALGMAAQSPLMQDFLSRERFPDLALALCTDPRMRLMSTSVPVVEQFIRERFGVTARFDREFEGRTFVTLRCRVEP